MRDALALLFHGAGFEVRSYATAEEFLADLRHDRPYCLVTDVRLPGMGGIALHRHLVEVDAAPVVVMITGHGDIPMAVAALKQGVADFVEKPFDPGQLLESVREASQRAAASYQERQAVAGIKQRLATLTAREREILDLLVKGQPTKVIAGILMISTRTAEHHRAHIMEKMQARSLSQLIRMVFGATS